MKSKDEPMIETANGDPLSTEAPPAPTGHPGEKLEQPIPADPIPTPDPAAKREKRTVEHWAREKGMLPEFSEGKRSPNAPAKAPAPLVHNPKFAPYHAARASLRWPIGMELTEAEFDKAIALNGGPPVDGCEPHVYR